jgi:hypothetical protein
MEIIIKNQVTQIALLREQVKELQLTPPKNHQIDAEDLKNISVEVKSEPKKFISRIGGGISVETPKKKLYLDDTQQLI